ncbi:chondroitin AC/alginate lyase [Aspergillus ambiguus]|uniref:chondroitin AC/alginate lyase n=1 Tax=Aspergillus ambiguus TaxID=176160 RepID=UPI003CCDDEB5
MKFLFILAVIVALSSSVKAVYPNFHHHGHPDYSRTTPTPTTPVSSSWGSGSTKTPTPSATTTLLARSSSNASNSFTHPGVFLSSAQLDYISSKVAASAQPWATAYQAMADDDLASRASPTPYATVSSDSSSDAELDDSLAAYLNALAWVITGVESHAERAINFMNSWSNTIQSHGGTNAPLQAGWAASSWTRAAEIIRYTDAGWASADISAFEEMLRDVYLPEVIVGSDFNGNWELVMMEAALGISVFIENRTSYNIAMDKFLNRAAAYVYLNSDGALPNAVDIDSEDELISYWYDQTTFVNGLSQETCRDFGHVGYGIASISHVAETSRIQGRDLYEEEIGKRLRYALEFHSKYENGASVPEWLCDGTVNLGLREGTEPGLNALSYRLGYTMNETEIYTKSLRPQHSNGVFVGWETLTHYENDA